MLLKKSKGFKLLGFFISSGVEESLKTLANGLLRCERKGLSFSRHSERKKRFLFFNFGVPKNTLIFGEKEKPRSDKRSYE